MSSFLTQIITDAILRRKNKTSAKGKNYSPLQRARRFRELRITVIRNIKDFVLITIGIFSAAFGFKGFLLTNKFIDGGATGISLLISALTAVPLSLLIVLINIPFIILGYNVIGRVFAIKTALAISGLALC